MLNSLSPIYLSLQIIKCMRNPHQGWTAASLHIADKLQNDSNKLSVSLYPLFLHHWHFRHVWFFWRAGQHRPQSCAGQCCDFREWIQLVLHKLHLQEKHSTFYCILIKYTQLRHIKVLPKYNFISRAIRLALQYFIFINFGWQKLWIKRLQFNEFWFLGPISSECTFHPK